MLKVKVKAASITNLTDARYFAAREVEWLGFPLEAGNETALSPAAVKAIKEWVDGVKFVGEFGFTPANEIKEIRQAIGLDMVQVGMFIPKEELFNLEGISLIKEVVVEESMSGNKLLEHLVEYAGLSEIFLLDFQKFGIAWEDLKKEKPFSLELLKSICSGNKVILNIRLTPENVDDILGTLQPFGLNLNGGSEEKTGFKSFDELDAIFDKLEISQ